MYIHITNGQIDYGPGTLPINWRNVSGLDGLNSEELKSLNWIDISDPPVYNPEWQIRTGPVIDIQGTEGDYIVTVSWSVEYKSSNELLSIKNNQVETLREEKIARGAPVNLGSESFTVQTRGEIDSRNINGLAGVAISSILLSQPFSIDFRDQDDVVHTLDAQQVLLMQSQIASWIESHYQVSWNHKANLKTLADNNDSDGIANYDVTTNWPN